MGGPKINVVLKVMPRLIVTVNLHRESGKLMRRIH